MTLTTPTPLQWQSLEESFYQYQRAQETDGVSAAPLVAILDSTNDSKNHGSQGRYATIAAIVGVSCSSSGSTTTMAMDTNSAFMESMAGIPNENMMIEHAKVRLVGVGRAVLKEFVYQVPTSLAQKAMDDEGHLLISEHGERLVGDDDDDDDEEPPVNVIMAQFAVIHDSLCSRAASPTHAVTHMGRLANQVEWLHQDRRNLVASIQAARTRLEKAEHQQCRAQELEDHDGLGLLFGCDDDAMSTAFNEVAVETKKTKKKKGKSKKKSNAATKRRETSSVLSTNMVQPTTTSENETSHSLQNMVNYGIGSSASSLTGLKELTQVLLETLTPYYSPTRCASEEHYYEMYSFVAVRAVESFVPTPGLAWSLRCVHTEQRLQRTYDWMTAHVDALKKEAERVSRALHDCGEECTDLF